MRRINANIATASSPDRAHTSHNLYHMRWLRAICAASSARVILAPHNGGATWEVRGARVASVARGIVTTMKGGRAPGLLNPEIYS
jgi:phosphoglycerate dehydrogenase-like enzyme